MLEAKLNDKTKEVQESVAEKLTHYQNEHEKELRNQKKHISIKIHKIEVQLRSKENEIKQLESKMVENILTVTKKRISHMK